jgi:hypothetical protein
MKKSFKKKIALSTVLMAGVLIFAACSNDTQSEEVSMDEEENHQEEVVRGNEVSEKEGEYNLTFSYQPGGNMDMPAAADLPIKLNLATVSPNNNLVGHVDYTLTLTNSDGQLVYETKGAHEHEGYHQVALSPLPEGEYTLAASVVPTMDTPEEHQFDEIKKEFTFTTMLIEANEEAEIALSISEEPKVEEATKLSFEMKNQEGDLIPHTDNFLQIVNEENVIVYQASNIHSHTGTFEVFYTFAESGEYTITLSSNPTPMRASVNFAPIGKQIQVTVAE